MTPPISFERCSQFVNRCLQQTGLASSTADDVAAALVTTEAMGVFTHGTKLLSGYIKKEIHAAPTAAGIDRVLLPGEREWNNCRHARVHGIDLPHDVQVKLRQSTELTGVSID